jgi:hypothetical protein
MILTQARATLEGTADTRAVVAPETLDIATATAAAAQVATVEDRAAAAADLAAVAVGKCTTA